MPGRRRRVAFPIWPIWASYLTAYPKNRLASHSRVSGEDWLNADPGFAVLPILVYSQAAIARFDRLVKLKLGVKKNDLRIAAIGLEAGGIVVSRNLRDFQRVPGLVCEDWSA